MCISCDIAAESLCLSCLGRFSCVKLILFSTVVMCGKILLFPMKSLLVAILFFVTAVPALAQESTLPPDYQAWPERHEYICQIEESHVIMARFFGKYHDNTNRIEVIVLVLIDAEIFSVTRGEISNNEGSRIHSYSIQAFEGWNTFHLSAHQPAVEAKKAEDEAIQEITGMTSAYIETVCQFREKLQEIKALLLAKLTPIREQK